MSSDKRCVIAGAGPAGLTAGYELLKTDVTPVLIEQDNVVGGISRTVEFQGYRFDLGGHRFFTRMQMIDDWWTNILGADMLERKRMSRIYYDNKFFDYPLKPLNAVIGLGPLEATRIGLSYVNARLFPYPFENTLEQWLRNRFGCRMYEIFFKSYTEKVWGMKCDEIDADWASQRIRNLDLTSAVRTMFLGNRGNEITSLVEQFRYPRLGPGMMWERVASILAEEGCPVRLGYTVTKLHLTNGRVVAVTAKDRLGKEIEETGSHFISSMPVGNLVGSLDPPVPEEVLQQANKLRYRDFLTVGLIVNNPDLFPDNWIYIHSPVVKVGRIQNFKNWSPEMVPDASKSSLGLEYFVQTDDELWSTDDEKLIELACKECAMLGLVNEEDIIRGLVVRMPKAYPVYDHSYKQSLSVIRDYLDAIPNLHMVGRNGQHRYNNQDHSMLTAIYAARNVSGAKHNVWDVNVESEYHEEVNRGKTDEVAGDRFVPQPVILDPVDVIRQAFARYDPIALGAAISIVLGLGLFAATAVLILKGGAVVGPNLSLVGQYLWGYDVTWVGSIVGLLETAFGGFLLGFVMAHAINAVVAWHERRLLQRLEVITTLRPPDVTPPQ